MMKALRHTSLILLAACGTAPHLDHVPPGAVVIPTEFRAGRYYAQPVLASGDTVTLFTDTGGGLFVYRDAAVELGIAVDSSGLVRLPEFANGEIPDPLGTPAVDGAMRVLDGERRLDADGMLGQAWFADRVWRFDYPNRRLLLLDTAGFASETQHVVPLGFLTDSTGVRTLSFPRVRIAVDGDSLDMLFDTGATVDLTEGALVALHDGGAPERATSFITTEVFERWRARHPDWVVIENADQNVDDMAIIHVPFVSIAGHSVGPVWFTERPDRNFHEYMSQWMDRRVDGALGGSAFEHFRITVDYQRALAHFELVN
jgi:hypothetical protein